MACPTSPATRSSCSPLRSLISHPRAIWGRPPNRSFPAVLPLSLGPLSLVRPLSSPCPRLSACLCCPHGSGNLLPSPSSGLPPFFVCPEALVSAVDLLAQRVPLCPAVTRGGPPDARSGAAGAGPALGVRCAPTGRRRHPAEGPAATAAGRQGSYIPPSLGVRAGKVFFPSRSSGAKIALEPALGLLPCRNVVFPHRLPGLCSEFCSVAPVSRFPRAGCYSPPNST